MDMDFESRTDVSIDEYIEMIRLKTAVLLACACETGALMGHASENTRRALNLWAENVGLAFQLRDDYLDTFGNDTTFGKKTGGDILNDKKTWLLITAMNEASDEIMPLLGAERTDAKIAAVKTVYSKLNLPARINELIDRYTVTASEALNGAAITQGDRQWFANLTADLSTRKF